MDSLTSEERTKVVELGQLLFQDLAYARTVRGTVADEAETLRYIQKHRHWYSPQEQKQRPHRWDMPALTRFLVAYCWCFNDWAKAQEKKAKHPLTPQDFLICYCTYLFGQTLYAGSAHVAIALGCHYWRYRPRQIGNLAAELINDPSRDRKRWAKRLQARFPTVAHDSLHVVTEAERDWVVTFWNLVAPASPVHDPPEVALCTLFDGMEQSQEGARLHTLLARCCGFVGLTRAYNTALKPTWLGIRRLPDPDDPAVQPRIPTVPGGGDTDVDPNNSPGPWSLPVPPRPADLEDLEKRFAEAQQERRQRRQQYRAGILQIRVDGEPIGEFDVQAAPPLQFQVPCEACRVQIYGQDAAGPLLLAVFPMAGVVSETRGKTVTLQLTAARQADGTLAEELVELTYLPPPRVAAFALGAYGFQQAHRLGSALAKRVSAATQLVRAGSGRLVTGVRAACMRLWHFEQAGARPPTWASVVTLLVLLGLSSVANVWLFQRVGTLTQQVAGQTRALPTATTTLSDTPLQVQVHEGPAAQKPAQHALVSSQTQGSPPPQHEVRSLGGEPVAPWPLCRNLAVYQDTRARVSPSEQVGLLQRMTAIAYACHQYEQTITFATLTLALPLDLAQQRVSYRYRIAAADALGQHSATLDEDLCQAARLGDEDVANRLRAREAGATPACAPQPGLVTRAHGLKPLWPIL